MTNFYLAQIVSIITILSTVLGLFQKEKFKTMLHFTISNISMIVTYALLERYLSIILVAIATIRTIVYYIYAYKNLKPNTLVVVSFEIVFVLVCMFLWTDYVDLLMLINLCMLAYTTWQDNMKILRIGYLISAILLIAYNLLVGAYVSSISEIILLVFSILVIIKYDIKNKIDNVVLDFYTTISKTYEIDIKDNENYISVFSNKIKDVFNNFIYVKNPLEYKKDIEIYENYLIELNRKPAIYFESVDNENIQTIMEIANKNVMLYHDVWMKLRTGYNTRHKKCLLENLEFKECDATYKKDILHLFDKGFIHFNSKNIYKYEEKYLQNYEEKLDNEYLIENHIVPYMAFYNNVPICLLFIYRHGTNAYICQITTLEQYRRKGVASALIRYAIQCERKNNIEDFYLVTEKYTFLETFYLKNNFVEISQGICIEPKKKPKNINE